MSVDMNHEFSERALAVEARRRELRQEQDRRFEAAHGDLEIATWEELDALMSPGELAEMPVYLCWCCESDISGAIYMVLDEVWLAAMPSPSGHLCFECLEKRLGRSLTGEDFKAVPGHAIWVFTTPGLAERLAR